MGKRYKTLPDAFGQGCCIGKRRPDFSFAPAGFCSVPTELKPASEIMRAARRGKQHMCRKHLHCFAYGKKFAEILRKISSDAQNGICTATHFTKLRFCFPPAVFALTPTDSLQGNGALSGMYFCQVRENQKQSASFAENIYAANRIFAGKRLKNAVPKTKNGIWVHKNKTRPLGEGATRKTNNISCRAMSFPGFRPKFPLRSTGFPQR